MKMAKKTRILACALALTGFVATARADDLSTSVMRPTPVDPATGLVAGNLPGGQGSKSYYVTVDLQAGDLIAQLQVAGTPNTGKKIELKVVQDPSVLGGLVARVGDTVIDGTVRRRLEQLRESL